MKSILPSPTRPGSASPSRSSRSLKNRQPIIRVLVSSTGRIHRVSAQRRKVSSYSEDSHRCPVWLRFGSIMSVVRTHRRSFQRRTLTLIMPSGVST